MKRSIFAMLALTACGYAPADMPNGRYRVTRTVIVDECGGETAGYSDSLTVPYRDGLLGSWRCKEVRHALICSDNIDVQESGCSSVMERTLKVTDRESTGRYSGTWVNYVYSPECPLLTTCEMVGLLLVEGL